MSGLNSNPVQPWEYDLTISEHSMHICYDSQSFSNKKQSRELQFQVKTGLNDGFLVLGEVEVYVSIERKKQMERAAER